MELWIVDFDFDEVVEWWGVEVDFGEVWWWVIEVELDFEVDLGNEEVVGERVVGLVFGDEVGWWVLDVDSWDSEVVEE